MGEVTSYLLSTLTLNGLGGFNQDAPCLEACCFLFDAPRSVRPQCIFLFWCLKLVEEKKIWGCKKIFLKNLDLKFFFQKFSIQKKFFYFSKFFLEK